MNDTPQHIYDLQLEIWLLKTPAERLRQQILDNEALYEFWTNVKPVEVDEVSEAKPTS